MPNDLSGNGTITISGAEVGAVFYWLSILEEAGPVVAEGSISGSEEVSEGKWRQTPAGAIHAAPGNLNDRR